MKPYYQDNYCTQYAGHILNVLPFLPAESVQCVVTSPPYWGLRDYGLEPQIWDHPGGCEHEWGEWQEKHDVREEITAAKSRTTNRFYGEESRCFDGNHQKHMAGQFCLHCNAWRGSLGLEPTPELYIKHLTDIFREIRRVLRKDGTCFLNLGDSYAGSTMQGGNGATSTLSGSKTWQSKNTRHLMCRNLSNLKPKDLVGIPWRVAFALQADGWYLRSDIIWSKPNPMPESVKDRPTKSHEYIFLLTKSAKYYWDQDAVREESIYPNDNRKARSIKMPDGWDTGPGAHGSFHRKGREKGQKRYPTDKISGIREGSATYPRRNIRSVWTIATQPFPKAHFATFPEKLVETCIKAGTKQGDTVLDPFSGRGTVLVVAKRMFRKAVGIDLKGEYHRMSEGEIREGTLDFTYSSPADS